MRRSACSQADDFVFEGSVSGWGQPDLREAKPYVRRDLHEARRLARNYNLE